MDMKQYKTSDISYASESFAVTIHDTWGVGGVNGREDGIVVFLSIDDRAVYISTGKDVKSIVTYGAIQDLIEAVKPDLRSGHYGKAISHIILKIDLLLNSGRTPHNKGEIFSRYGLPQKYDAQYELDMQKQAGRFFLMCFLGIVGLFGSCACWNYRREKRLEVSKAKLETLMKDVTRSMKDNKYVTTACPICLEDYAVEPEQEGSAKEAYLKSPLRQVKL